MARKTNELHVYLDPATIKRVERLAKAEMRSVTKQCECLIVEALQARRSLLREKESD